MSHSWTVQILPNFAIGKLAAKACLNLSFSQNSIRGILTINKRML